MTALCDVHSADNDCLHNAVFDDNQLSFQTLYSKS